MAGGELELDSALKAHAIGRTMKSHSHSGVKMDLESFPLLQSSCAENSPLGSPKHRLRSSPVKASGLVQRSQSPDACPSTGAATLELFFAVAEGDTGTVQRLLACRVDPNLRDYEQKCPLHVAAGTGRSLGVVNSLLDAKANVDVSDCFGQSPLHLSQRWGNARVAELLQARGAQVRETSSRLLAEKAVSEKWEINRAHVELGETIMQTHKSIVSKAKWKSLDVCAKICLSDSNEEEAIELQTELLHEIALLASLRHPDLVMFLGCCLQESPFMCILEYMPRGDLESYYRSRANEIADKIWHADKHIVSRWAKAIVRALSFLHQCSQPIIHRDLKPLNLLLTENLELKVGDFGISKMINQHPSPLPKKQLPNEVNAPSYKMTGGVGSWRYMAPEVARHEVYDEKVDIYSFGLILYFMSSGRQPFHWIENPQFILDEYCMGKEPRPEAAECPTHFRPIMTLAWASCPGTRPPAQDLVDWLGDVYGSSAKCECRLM